MIGVRSVKDGGLPAKPGELAGDGGRDPAGGLAPRFAQVLPAWVEAALGAPGGLDDGWVLAWLAAGERLAIVGRRRYWCAASISSRRAWPGPAWVIDPCRRLVSEVRSLGTMPRPGVPRRSCTYASSAGHGSSSPRALAPWSTLAHNTSATLKRSSTS
jgi:hypothetical protein